MTTSAVSVTNLTPGSACSPYAALKRHQCCIDLKDNLLKLGTIDKTIPFLGESELPSFAKAMGEPEEEAWEELPAGSGGAGGSGGGGGAAGAGAGAGAGAAGGAAGGGASGGASPWAPAPAAAAAAPTPAAAPAAAAPAAGDMEAKVAKLIELGFDRAKCLEALSASGGDQEYAASILFSGM
jgi:DNA damage-inducible protein 1